MKNSPLSHSQLAAEEQQAATIGRAAVLVMPGADEAANAASAAADGAIAAISEQQLLCVLAIGDASMVQAAVDAFRQRQQQLQAPATGAAAAADSEDLTEVDDGDEGVVDEDESQLQAVIPVVHGRKQQQRTPGKHGKGDRGLLTCDLMQLRWYLFNNRQGCDTTLRPITEFCWQKGDKHATVLHPWSQPCSCILHHLLRQVPCQVSCSQAAPAAADQHTQQV